MVVDIFFYLRGKLIFLRKNPLFKLLYMLVYFIYRFISWLYGSSIPLGTSIAGKPIFPHGMYGIFISNKAAMGRDITILQHVTIGSVLDASSKLYGAPTIGNNVFIGAGAKIIGNVTVHDNVKIGPNVVVHFDVPEGKTVVLDNARVI